MRIIIIGGGEVGTELARRLSADHDVVVIEQNKKVAELIEEEIDCQVIVGNGASTRTLKSANIQKAGLLIAATEIDEVNIVACMVAKRFGVEKTVARLRNPEYTEGKHALSNEVLGIDYIINPERVAAEEIAYFILNPGILESDYYAGGRLHVSGYKVDEDFPYLNKQLKDVKMPPSSIVCAIIRDNEVIIPDGKTRLMLGDDVYVLGKTEDPNAFLWMARNLTERLRVFVAGGGRVGLQLAKYLEKIPTIMLVVNILEKDLQRCEEISEELERTQVFHGDVTDVNFLKQMNVGEADIFVATTGDDEVNLLSTLLAKKLGAKKTASEVVRKDYNLILSSIGIDRVVSPRLLTANMIIRLLKRGSVLGTTILREGKVEMIEAVVPEGAPVTGKKIKEAGLPAGILLGAIAREDMIIIPDGNERLLAGDRIVAFAVPGKEEELDSLFSSHFTRVLNIPPIHKSTWDKQNDKV